MTVVGRIATLGLTAPSNRALLDSVTSPIRDSEGLVVAVNGYSIQEHSGSWKTKGG
jgi:hypothetical protein